MCELRVENSVTADADCVGVTTGRASRSGVIEMVSLEGSLMGALPGMALALAPNFRDLSAALFASNRAVLASSRACHRAAMASHESAKTVSERQVNAVDSIDIPG